LNIYRNQYKREDIFICDHITHKNFNKSVSVYHVMIKKKCYPHGCVNFKYKCKFKRKCPKGFHKAGLKCENCKYLVEEKYVKIPKIIDEERYKEFCTEMEDFNLWLGKIKNRVIQFWGNVNSVKPFFEKIISSKNEKILHRGFIVSFEQGYINSDFWDDYCYLLLNKNQYRKIKPHPGDEIEFSARLKFTDGRIILQYPSKINFVSKTEGKLWENEDVLLAKSVGKTHISQPDKCFRCDQGILIEVTDRNLNKFYRQIYCLEGIENFEDCYYYALLKEEQDSKDEVKNERN